MLDRSLLSFSWGEAGAVKEANPPLALLPSPPPRLNLCFGLRVFFTDLADMPKALPSRFPRRFVGDACVASRPLFFFENGFDDRFFGRKAPGAEDSPEEAEAVAEVEGAGRSPREENEVELDEALVGLLLLSMVANVASELSCAFSDFSDMGSSRECAAM